MCNKLANLQEIYPNKSDGFIFFCPVLFEFFPRHNPLWIDFSLTKVRLTQDVTQGLPDTGVKVSRCWGLVTFWGYLGSFWVAYSTSDTRLEKKKRSNHPSPQCSVEKAPWVWAEFREVFDQRLRLSHRSMTNSVRRKKIVQLSVAYISMSNISTSPPSNLIGKMCNVKHFGRLDCLSSGKIGWATWIPPKKENKPHANLWRSPCALRCLRKKSRWSRFFLKPTQYCRVVFIWFYYP